MTYKQAMKKWAKSSSQRSVCTHIHSPFEGLPGVFTEGEYFPLSPAGVCDLCHEALTDTDRTIGGKLFHEDCYLRRFERR